MSYGRTEEGGKDVIVFLSEEDAQKPAEPQTASASAQGAYNEETGEINWDCPCLGAMTKPPCGETFKAAFSCFVYSKEEPKGIDCVEKFRAMQTCFREHPEIYGDELDDEEPQESSSSESSSDASTLSSLSASETTADATETTTTSERDSHKIKSK